MMPIPFTTALPTSASGKMESWPTSTTTENASGKAEPISHDTPPSRVAYPLRSLQRVGPSSLSFSQRHLNSRRVAELSGAFLVGGSGTLGDRTLFRRARTLETASTFLGGLPFAKFAKGGPLFSFFFPGHPNSRRVAELSGAFLVGPTFAVQIHGSIFNIPASIIKTPTTPRPVPWMLHKFCFNRVRMDVVQLLPHFRARVDVKIVIPPQKFT